MSSGAATGWGVVGCGRMVEKRMGPALLAADRIESLAFCSRDLAKAHSFADRFGAAAYGDVEAMLADPLINIIYIALPHTLHADMAIRCLQAGKHVLTDKPAATNAADVERMLQTADEQGRILRVLHQQRFHNGNRRVLKLATDGTLGRVHFVRIQIGMWMRGYSAWRFDPTLSGGGALMDLGPHALDLMIDLLGAPQTVSATTKHLALNEPVEDFCAATIEFDHNRIGVIDLSYSIHAYGGQIDVFGDEGSAVARGSMQQAPEYSLAVRVGHDDRPIETSTDTGDCFAAAIDAMHAAIDNNELPNDRKCLTIARVIDAAYESARTGVRVRL